MPMIPGPKEQSVLPDGQLAYQSSPGATPDAFGAGVGQAIQGAGAAADSIAMRNFQIKNEGDRIAAENELMSRAQDLQNGNKDKGIVGYRTLIGKNAVDALPDYQAKLNDAYKEVREGLNPAVARMFDSTGFRIVRGSMDSMGAYGAQQQVVGAHQDARARVQLAQQGALTYADDPTPAGWDAHLSDVQEASMAGSRILGLGPDAVEEQRRQDLGKVFIDRTKDLMNRDPMEAAKFFHDNISMVPAEHRFELGRALGQTTTTHYNKSDGLDAYHEAIAQPSASPLPAAIPGARDKPYDQKTVASRAAFVNSKTPWDAEIDTAAKTFNVSPYEIKLKIAMESMGNPQAVNPEGGHGDHATGLGQFTADTAKRYGVVDRNDPVQSINGIAKMLAANGGTVGGNMAGSDRAYFGGNVNAKGPNTDQYVENARAVRQAAMGGGAAAPLTAAQLEGREADVIRIAQAKAEARAPGNVAARDGTVAEAMRSLHIDVQALKGKDYQNFSQVLDATIKTSALSEGDLPPEALQTYSQLSPQNQLSIRTQFAHNAAAARGEFTHSDPKLVNDLVQRVYLPEGDPRKITQPGQLTEYMGKGLNDSDRQRLTKEITDANTPEGSPFLKQVAGVKNTGRKMLVDSYAAMAHPEFAEEAAYRFSTDLDAKIKAARSGKIDPQSLLTPGSKDYVLDPGKVAGFMPTEAQITARKAGAGAPKEVPATDQRAGEMRISNAADYAALRPGSVYLDPNGIRRRKP